MRIVVKEEVCNGCGICPDSCPFTAIEMRGDKAFITDFCDFCRTCMSVCPVGAIVEVAEESDRAPTGDIASYRGVWVFAEQRHGRVASVAFELLGVGRTLADQLGADLSAVLFGSTEEEAAELIRWGADRVYHARTPLFDHFNDEPYSQLLIRMIRQQRPAVVLTGATPIGRSFMPRVAATLKTGLTADCTGLEIDPETGNLLQVRPAFGGNIMATILCPRHRPQIATVRPRVMKRAEYQAGRTGEIIPVAAGGLESRTRVIESVRESSECTLNLQEAEIIVSGGRGLGGPQGFQLIAELAQVLGGAVGSSRAGVDEGWIPYSHQVGQTGKTVCPKIYVACGISGAVQHLVGMQSSDIIVAINRNAEAPIFNVATYGIVGDLYEIVPLMIRELKETRGESS